VPQIAYYILAMPELFYLPARTLLYLSAAGCKVFSWMDFFIFGGSDNTIKSSRGTPEMAI
jgi:hypothetical protein